MVSRKAGACVEQEPAIEHHVWVTHHLGNTLQADESIPAWPEAAAGGLCACGADLEYVQIVNRLLPSPTSPTQM